MELPEIDIDSLPDLGTVTGVFGSLADGASATLDDRIIIIMVYLYNHASVVL